MGPFRDLEICAWGGGVGNLWDEDRWWREEIRGNRERRGLGLGELRTETGKEGSGGKKVQNARMEKEEKHEGSKQRFLEKGLRGGDAAEPRNA